ncbi:MAG TPA: glycosyltransferase [Candidatus Acidoferrales bacterium]
MRRKILHVIGAMDRGGVETWLMHMLRAMDPNDFETHYLVHTSAESAYDREIAQLGGHVHRGANPKNPVRYAVEFERLNRRFGGFDVVHSHVYWFSGFIMRLAYNAGIPTRIAHSHTSASEAKWNIPRKIYQKVMKRWISVYATHRIGISHQAGQALFGKGPGVPYGLLYYGMDFSRFLEPLPSADAKRSLGIAPGRKVMGHVGRFAPVKNHAFTIELMARLIGNGTDAHLLLVGDGPAVPSIREQIISLGLSDRVTLAGSQADVMPYLSAMDVFVLPSHWEGFGLVALESQAVGVPVIASTGVPNDVDVIPGLVEHIPLSSGVDGWASAVQRKFDKPTHRKGDEAVVLTNSKYGSQSCLDALRRIYFNQSSLESQ